MGKNSEIKPVSFNPDRAMEAAMLEHVKRRNFSGYVKKLIWEDMKTKGATFISISTDPDEEDDSATASVSKHMTAAERLERLKQRR